MFLPKIEEWIKEIEQRPGLAIYRNADAFFLCKKVKRSNPFSGVVAGLTLKAGDLTRRNFL